MAWRPDKCIIRGEIDNTVKGRVTGSLWLLGRDQPMLLDLSGDAAPDVAGTKLTFVNPNPLPQPECDDGLQQNQTGAVGDITASQKVKQFTVPKEEWLKAYQERRMHEVPWVMKNALYLEWFSDSNGRIVVQTTDYEINISERHWELDPDEQAAQQALNVAEMQSYMEQMGDALEVEEPKDEDEPTDEV
jgi:hypothetical protein